MFSKRFGFVMAVLLLFPGVTHATNWVMVSDNQDLHVTTYIDADTVTRDGDDLIFFERSDIRNVTNGPLTMQQIHKYDARPWEPSDPDLPGTHRFKQLQMVIYDGSGNLTRQTDTPSEWWRYFDGDGTSADVEVALRYARQ